MSGTTGVITVAKLSIQLTEIPDEGLDLTDEVQPDELNVLPEEAQVNGLLSLSTRLTKAGTRVYADGRIKGAFVQECVRCLKQYETQTEVPFRAEYQIPDPTARSRGRVIKDHHQESDEQRVSEPDQDEDVYRCTGDRVELAEMLREHIILSTPMQPLCHEQCQGLCPVCGRNRNEDQCGCIEQPQSNPFSTLQERWRKS